VPFPSADRDIFDLDKLFIPINIEKNHYFTVGVFMKERIIRVFDSLPDSRGRLTCKQHILQYLDDEHLTRHKVALPDRHLWKLVEDPPTFKTPCQSSSSNDCGIFTCLFMDFLLLNLPLTDLTQERILAYGREWLCKCILKKCISF